MITREAADVWALTELGRDEPYLRLSWVALAERLLKTGLWSEEQLATLHSYEVGQSTKPPFSYYVRGGTPYASKNGDIDRTKKLDLDVEGLADGYYIRGMNL